MLETMRRHSRNVLIYLIFGILIAVFVISFGPQSGPSQQGGCMPSSSWVAKVGRHDIEESSWRFALLSTSAGGASGARARAARVRENVMDELIKRELLAGAAEESGFRVSDSEVEDRIARGEIYVMGYPVEGKQIYMKDGKYFDDKLLEMFVKSRGLPTLEHFVEEQRREMLAEKMRELLRASVRVSPEEVEQAWRQMNTKVSAEYVKFEPYRYARDVVLAPADVDAFAQKKDEELKKKYESQKQAYTGLPKQARIRQIYVRSAVKDKGEEATTQPTAKGPMPDPDRAKAEAALNRLKAGGDFVAVAKEFSDQDRLALPVWRSLQSLAPKELRETVEKMEPGKTSDVIDTATGYYIVKVEAHREGDQSYEQVKRDLAEEMLREERARDLAKADAHAALEKAKAGTPLDQQFERVKPIEPEEPALPELPIPPPEMVPPPPAPPAPAPAPTKAPAPGKQGFYDDDGTFWHYAQADLPRQVPVRPPPPREPKAADRPKVLSAENLVRTGNKLSGLGESAELTNALFEKMKPGELGPKVFEVEALPGKVDYVVVKLVQRDEPNMEEYGKKKAELASDFALVKSYRLLDDWTSRRCKESKDRGEIAVNQSYVDYGDVDEKTGKQRHTPYEPCAEPLAIPGLPPGFQFSP